MAVAIPIIEVVATVASVAVAAYGAVQAGKARRNAADYNAEVARQNALAAQQQGEAAAEQQQREMRQKIGATEAAYGASGIDASQGTPIDVLTDSVRQGTLDNLTIKYNYALKGAGYTDNATLDTFQGKNALTSSYMEAGGDLASGVANAAGDYEKYQFQQKMYGSGTPVGG